MDNISKSSLTSLRDINSFKLQSIKNNQKNFATLLNKTNTDNKLSFSKHATNRLKERNIELSNTLLDKLNNAARKAHEKGAKDVAVITANGAFIINVPNMAVVTGMSRKEMQDNIFTNIDSAIII